MEKIRRTSILVDNDSWILPYAKKLIADIENLNLSCSLVRNENDIPPGDVCFFLGCTKIVSDSALNLNSLNLVVHESDLPKGKGFSPMAWQILDNKKEIIFTLLEASSNFDSGRIWLQSNLQLDGHELCDEWRDLQGKKTQEICLSFLKEYENLTPKEQIGTESFFRRRTSKDSEIDTRKSINELFPILRVVDNERYPAYFVKDGVKYKIKIEKS